MTLEFTKMSGAGNDFILADDRSGKLAGLSRTQVARLCHRQFGVGADDGFAYLWKPAYDVGPGRPERVAKRASSG